MTISEALRKIIAALEKVSTSVDAGAQIPDNQLPVETARRLRDPDPGVPMVKQGPLFGPDGRAVDDFWVRGIPAAAKGAHNRHYSSMRIVLGWMGGDMPKHNNVCVAMDEHLPWEAALKRAGDIGWLDGASYRYDPAASSVDNFWAWCRAGSPLRTPEGLQYDSRGKPISADEPDFSPSR